jgi:pyruvate formate lyase activating enzyme
VPSSPSDDDTLAGLDLTLLDLKAYRSGTYRRITGGDVAPRPRSARGLAALGRPMTVRYMLVPGG